MGVSRWKNTVGSPVMMWKCFPRGRKLRNDMTMAMCSSTPAVIVLVAACGDIPYRNQVATLPETGRYQGTYTITAGVLLHIAIVMSFLNFLPMGKHFHIITGLPTVFFQRLTPMGQLSKLDLEHTEKFGVAKITDLSWKEILDTYSCTECGRCQTYCPTYDTGKPLTHKEVNRAIRHHAQQAAAAFPLPIASLLHHLNRIKPLPAPTNGHGADGHGS